LAAAFVAFEGIAMVPDRESPVFAHRDLHDKQIIRAGSRIGIIDWDWAAAAPRALDPGNFLAHLQLRALQRRITAKQALAARHAFLAAYRDGRGGGPPNLESWETLALLRLAAVYALRPSWPGLAEKLLVVARRSR
jgi:aminoglycoside phosphotransferase (APT) family kinase protein